MDIDEAEEQFQQRNRVMNQFALKAQIQQHIRNKDELESVGAISKALVKINFIFKNLIFKIKGNF